MVEFVTLLIYKAKIIAYLKFELKLSQDEIIKLNLCIYMYIFWRPITCSTLERAVFGVSDKKNNLKCKLN